MTEQQMADAGYQQNSNGQYVNIGGLGNGQSPANAPVPPPGSYMVNPGSVWQTYNPATGTTGYGSAPTGFYSGGVNGAPAVETPTNTPLGVGQVYQGYGLGTMPMSASSMFTTRQDAFGNDIITSDYALNPASSGDVSNRISPAAFENNVAKDIQNYNQTTAKEQADKFNAQYAGAILAARRKGLSGYLDARDQAKEADAAAKFKAAYGREPSTSLDAQLIDNALYGGKKLYPGSGTAQVNPGSIPGANTYNPDSLNIPDPSITNPNTGMIDYNAFRSSFLKEWDAINAEVKKAKLDIANFKSAAGEQQINLGAQTGTEMSLLQGDMAEAQKRANVQLQRLTDILGITEDEKNNLIQRGEFELSIADRIERQNETIYNRARDLRKDQQDAFAMMMDTAIKSGISSKDLTNDQRNFYLNAAKAIGIDGGFMLSSLDAIAARTAAEDYKSNLMTVNGGLYNVATGKYVVNPKSSGGSGSGSGTVSTKFWNAIDDGISRLRKGEDWGTVWNRIKAQFPDVDNSLIDTGLGGSAGSGGQTGPGGMGPITKPTEATGWARKGAYQEYISLNPSAAWKAEGPAWQWLSQNTDKSDDEKKQYLMSVGLNPEDFGVY